MNVLEAIRYDDLRCPYALRTWAAGVLTAVMLFGVFGVAVAGAQTLAHRDRDEVRIHPLEAGAEGAVEALENQNVALDLQEASFEEALWTIARAGQLGLSYNSDLHPKREITLQEELSVEEALQRLLAPTKLKALISSNREVVLVKRDGADEETVQGRSMEEIIQYVDIEGKGASGTSQDRASRPLQGTITGTVTDSVSGEPLPGVNVVISDTTQGTATGPEGTFTISNVEPGTYDLQASFIGYAPKRIEDVEVTEGEATEVNFSLVPSTLQLEEVVAVGYGEQEREDLTGAISSVSGQQMSDLPVTGLEEALQGRATGVDVRPTSGAPGAGAVIEIRGATTFGDTTPLYVIDGMPISNIGGGQANPLNLINPNNIESVEILKDASATAIYGTRAANGVVLIETTRGESGDTRVSFDLSGGIQNFANTFEMLSSQGYARLVNDARRQEGESLPPATQNPEGISRNTDWQEEAFQTGAIQDYSMSVSGGGEEAQYSVSGSYLNEQGTLPESHYKRYNLRLNSNFDLTPNLNISESVMLARSNWEGGQPGGGLTEMLLASPLMPIRCPENEGGFCGPTPETAGPNPRPNVIGQIHLVEDTETQNRVLGNVQLEYDILPSLSLRANLGGDYYFSENFTFTPTWEMEARSNTVATLDKTISETRSLVAEPTLYFDRIFFDVHDISATLGYTRQEEISKFMTGNRREFPSNRLRTIDAGLGPANLQGERSEWAVQSVFGRVNYNYDSRYLLTATLRRDGSSRFGPESRWGNFPSFSLGWRLSEESFMEDISGLSNLKIRGGWGRVGNQTGIGNYASWSTIDPVADYIFGNELSPGATFITLGNPNLGWEATEQINFGIDAAILGGSLFFSANYYQKNTEGLLFNVPINVTSGIFRNNGPVRNVGEMKNSGLEFETTYNGGSQEGFQYTISANLSTVNNEVVELGGDREAITEQLSIEGAQALTYTAEGDEIGAHYGYVMDGVFADQSEVDQHAIQSGAEPGDVRFQDLNGDDVINDQDRKVIGSPFPDFTYSVGADLSYHRFSLSVFLDGLQGRDIYNLQRAALMRMRGVNNAYVDAEKRWTPENRETNVPRATTTDPNDNNRPSSRFLKDGSFLRISRVKVGYSFDVPNGINEEGSRLRVYVAAQNLKTFTGYEGWNPDFGSSGRTDAVDLGAYPISRQWNAGIQVTF
jgi:TonB-linked SusC/RagA family outer membrane protein